MKVRAKKSNRPKSKSVDLAKRDKLAKDPIGADAVLFGMLTGIAIIGILILFYIDITYYFLNKDTHQGGWLAGLLYIIVAILVFGGMLSYALVSFVGIILQQETPWVDRVCYAIAFLLPVAAIYFKTSDTWWTDIDGEGSYQLGLGLKLIHEDPNFGIYSVVYASGYVARQYILAALPSYFFSSGLIPLRIGNSYFYVISYLALLSSLAGYLKARQAARPVLLSAFAGASFSLSTYPIMYARLFEQTTMPLGASCAFLAALFSFLFEASKNNHKFLALKLFWLMWTVGFCADGYTPALATGMLALCVLLYLIFIPRFNHPFLFVPLVHGVVSLVNANFMLHQFNATDKLIVGLDDYKYSDWIWRYFNGLYDVFGAERTLISYPLGLFLILALYFSYKWRDVRIPLLCLWCLAVIWASLSIIGSYFDSPDREIHRSMIILPFLACAVILFYHQYRMRIALAVRNILHLFAAISVCLLAYTSLVTPPNHCNYVYIDMYYNEALQKINLLEHDHSQPTLRQIYIVPPLNIPGGFEDALTYFAPGAKVVLTAPPDGVNDPNTYVLAFRTDNPEDRGYDCIIPSRHTTPYLRLVASKDWTNKAPSSPAP